MAFQSLRKHIREWWTGVDEPDPVTVEEHCYLSGQPKADEDHKIIGTDRAWPNHTVINLKKCEVVGHLCLFHGSNAIAGGFSIPRPECLG